VAPTQVRGWKDVAVLSLALALAAEGCAHRPQSRSGKDSRTSGALARPQATSAVPVVVAKVQRSSIPIELHAIGTGKAFKTVSVESQTAGIIRGVHYRPGSFVHKGDLLVTLDRGPFLAALSQVQATLTRDKSQAQLDQMQAQRYLKLYKQGIASKEQYDQYQATKTSAGATVAADEAAVQTARIELSYCSIDAPISGVTGEQLVYSGATVTANGAPVLVVINQVSPLYITFSVPQQYLGQIKDSMAQSRLPIEAIPPDGTTSERGYLSFVNNTVDSNTGTVELMGTFPNTDQRLWPGQFSNVELRLGEQRHVLVIPSVAVQAGQQGKFVFVVKPDMTVDVRPVKIGQAAASQAEVLQGLSVGETVVTDGQVRLVPGSKVYFTKAP
jgi:membrane fusion protein, multidrug efflux system